MSDRLTALDESFLHMERDGLPMHVASIATFEAGPLLDDSGKLRLDDIVRHIESRAALLPRLRKRLWFPPGGIDHARWVDDEDFDIRRHIDVVEAGAPGDDDALLALAAETEAELLDRAHPLWHMRMVTGLSDGRVGLIQRTHHAMIDGVSGVDVAAVTLDLTPDAGPDELPDWSPEPLPHATEAVVDLVRSRLSLSEKILREVGHDLLHPVQAAERVTEFVGALASFVRTAKAPECSLNVPVGPRRDFVWIRGRLWALKNAGHEAGATVNDVILNVVAGGLRALFLARGEVLAEDATVRVLVPVSLRTDGEHGTLGNRVGAMLPALPVGIADPTARLHRICVEMADRKQHHDAAADDLVLGAVDLLPTRVAELITRAIDDQHLINLVITNVPGPREPLYLMGARMLEVFPVVPLAANLSLGVAIFSYGDTVNIGVTVDPDACPDVGAFVDGAQQVLRAIDADWR